MRLSMYKKIKFWWSWSKQRQQINQFFGLWFFQTAGDGVPLLYYELRSKLRRIYCRHSEIVFYDGKCGHYDGSLHLSRSALCDHCKTKWEQKTKGVYINTSTHPKGITRVPIRTEKWLPVAAPKQIYHMGRGWCTKI